MNDYTTLQLDRIDRIPRVALAHPLGKEALPGVFDTSTALELVTFQSADHQEALAAIRDKRRPKSAGRRR